VTERISIIIPVYNEAAIITDTIDHVTRLTGGKACECIVVDGTPEGTTIGELKGSGVTTATAGKGRGRQMNRGASLATGTIFLFLHADTTLPAGALEHIAAVMSDGRYAGGAFDLSILSNNAWLRLVARVGSLRSRVTRIPYGDQGIFVRRDVFQALGGFRDIPIMEDVDFMRRLKARRERIHITRMKAGTSPRRWEEEGYVFGTLRNWTLMLLYLFGMKPEKLARFYQ